MVLIYVGLALVVSTLLPKLVTLNMSGFLLGCGIGYLLMKRFRRRGGRFLL